MVSDDASLLAERGSVGIFPGSSRNIKVTEPLDLVIATAIDKEEVVST